MLTQYARKEEFIYILGSFLLCLGCFAGAYFTQETKVLSISLIAFGTALLIFTGLAFNFFLDPERKTPPGDHLFISPADGVVCDIEEVDEPLFLKRKACRIGIFMSAFAVHVNRNPANGKVKFLQHDKGKFQAVFSAEAAIENEKQWIGLDIPGFDTQVMVCQVAGLLARRIHCPLELEEDLERGKRFGMIKFGSRVELYLPLEMAHTVKVKLGEKAIAGETILFELEQK